MNVQTEHIDNHKAQFTVEIETEQLDDAKRKAAKQLSRRVRIKGFRKGKAPYRIVAQYLGEAAILEEAVEILGNDIYKHALDESEVEPYGPGALDDFKVEPTPTFVFSVPLQPEVDLKDYTDIRLDFEVPEIDDEDIENALEQLRRREAEVSDEEVTVLELGHRATLDIHSEFADGEEADDDEDDNEPDADDGDDVVDSDESESDEDDDTEDDADEEDDEDDTPYVPKKGDNFFHRHDVNFILGEDEPILPGFAEALVGAKVEEDVQFELTVPDDKEDYKDIAGRKVTFHVTVTKAEALTLPDLDDEFARHVTTADGDEPLDLEGLRARTRDDIEKEALQRAKSEYGEKVLEKVIEGAEIAFPELMLEERIDDMLRDLDNQLQQQGMNLDSYMRITGTTKESLQEQYRDNAVESLNRSLVLGELIDAQNIEMGDEQIEKRLDNMMMQFGSQGDQFRNLIDTPQMRTNILNELLMDNIITRLVAIGRGEDPDKAVEEREAEVDAENEQARLRIEKMMAMQEEATAQAEAESEKEDTSAELVEAEETEAEDEVSDSDDGSEEEVEDNPTEESVGMSDEENQEDE